MSTVLVARDLWKSYVDGDRSVPVLRCVEISAAAGELIAIVGQSGSGKSTLLHLLGALDLPDRGSIEVAGENLGRLDPVALARLRNRKVGFIFQFHRLLADFDALENVMMPGRIGGLDPKIVYERARALLVEVGLEKRLDFFPAQLSGGERQRVAICRALLLEPPLLLADEPTGNLDPQSAEQVFEILIALQARHQTTTLLVTHNPDLANRCGRILALDGGHLRPRSAGLSESDD